MNYSEWEKEIEKLDKVERERMLKALDMLQGWETFQKEFNWTGIFALKTWLRRTL